MIQLVYVSASTKPFSNEQLLQLLASSRRNNHRLGVTGMLLYKDGDFMQALEGDQDAVHELSEKIRRDPRHTGIRVLLESAASEREFPDWSMGFQNLNEVDPRDIPGYTTFLDSPLRSHVFGADPALCRRLLLLFKKRTAVAQNQ